MELTRTLEIFCLFFFRGGGGGGGSIRARKITLYSWPNPRFQAWSYVRIFVDNPGTSLEYRSYTNLTS